MAKAPKEVIELRPDAWQRFERAMAVVVKSPPQHRVKPKVKRLKTDRQTKKPGK